MQSEAQINVMPKSREEEILTKVESSLNELQGVVKDSLILQMIKEGFKNEEIRDILGSIDNNKLSLLRKPVVRESNKKKKVN